MCKASIFKECLKPSLLTEQELYDVDITKILIKYIYIHQNFVLDSGAKLVTIKSENDKEIKLYSIKGSLIVWHGKYIGENGFMYVYDEKFERYTYAILHEKYQFWDISKISLNF
jgi:hypothetical protein